MKGKKIYGKDVEIWVESMIFGPEQEKEQER